MKRPLAMDYLWLIVVMLGPVLLGGAIIFATMRQRHLSRRERDEQVAATREFYEEDEAADPRPQS